MTREEAINILTCGIAEVEWAYPMEYATALDMAIEALEQEPEEDCISMQAAIDVVRQYCIDNQIDDGDYHANGIKYELKELPYAQPEPKRGKWIDEAEEIKKEINRHEYRCSICNCKANYYVGGYDDWWNVEKPNYCPNCGARMESDE